MNPARPFLDHTPQIHEPCPIDKTSVVAGEASLVGDVPVWPCVVLRGDVNSISIGARSDVQDGSVLYASYRNTRKLEGSPFTIGEDVTVGHKITLYGCRIGDRVLIGMGVIILDDTVVENDMVIGAGSPVPLRKHLESDYLYVGSPVRQVRLLAEKEKESLKYSSTHYTRLVRQHRQLEQFSDDLAHLRHSTFPFT